MSWQLLFVLHNLELRQPFDSDHIAIVGPSDQRLVDFVGAHPAAGSFVGGFVSTGGRPVKVSALMLRNDAPAAYKTSGAVYSFRNIFALASLFGGTQEQMRHETNHCVTYATYFDFHPVQLDRDNIGLITTSPAIRNWNEASVFRGQPDPAIINTSILQPNPDPMLRGPLIAAWKRHTENHTTSRALTVLFRSLEVAYQAASIPSSSSIHEYGARVALWVSAIEILAHPANGNANLRTALELLDELEWNDARLRRRAYVVPHGNNPPRRRFIGKLYRELYRARNDFLHGNDVTVERLFPFRQQDLPALPRTAPLIYKAALLAYLHRHRDRRRTRAQADQEMANLWEQGIFEECILKVHEGA